MLAALKGGRVKRELLPGDGAMRLSLLSDYEPSVPIGNY